MIDKLEGKHMQNKAKNTTNKKKGNLKPIYKPYLRGNVASKAAAKHGLRIIGYTLVFVFIYLLAGSALTFENTFLRIVANAVLPIACGMVLYAEGSHQGETDVGFAEIAQERINDGRKVPESELDLCYNPLKGVFSVVIGALPLFIVCLVYAFLAEKEGFSLGVLPSWVNTYEHQGEVALGLSYYHETTPFALVDMLRVVVRLINFPYFTMAGVNNYGAMYLMDKLSPLLYLLVPSCYALGYLRGPYLRALVHGSIRVNRRKHNKREQRARQQRKMQMQKKTEKKELI